MPGILDSQKIQEGDEDVLRNLMIILHVPGCAHEFVELREQDLLSS